VGYQAGPDAPTVLRSGIQQQPIGRGSLDVDPDPRRSLQALSYRWFAVRALI